MPTDRGNFEAWFVRPLECLYPKAEQFGFIIVMVTFPLLERYLRQKENITGITGRCAAGPDRGAATVRSAAGRDSGRPGGEDSAAPRGCFGTHRGRR
jgi:hypothetical protein